jgi:enoyl-CoA hydratase/carnithine racemase
MADLVLYDPSLEDERIGIVTLNHPEKRNALSRAMLVALDERLRAIAHDGRVNVVILRGMGTVFSSGHDLREILEGDPLEVLDLFETCFATMQTMRQMPQIVVAEVHGIATAAGLQLVATADLAVASSVAKFATPGVKIGFFCSTPAVALSRNIGRKKAAELLFTGEFMDAEDALRSGLVNRVVPPEELGSATVELARLVARHARATLALGKKHFYRQLGMDEFDALAYMSQVMATNSAAPDAKEGISAFLTKRQPVWTDRRVKAEVLDV